MSEGVVVVDYGAGNLTSVQNALHHLGCSFTVTGEADVVRRATRVIFPGVGEAAAAMQVLRARGLDGALRDVYEAGAPLLGICLGSHIVLERSEERSTPCIGLLAGTARKLPRTDPRLKVPHMGWNRVRLVCDHPLFVGIEQNSSFYFVHSYYPDPAERADVLAMTDHGVEFPAVIGRGNLVATQFHTEKSGGVGLRLLRNFLSWDGVWEDSERER